MPNTPPPVSTMEDPGSMVLSPDPAMPTPLPVATMEDPGALAADVQSARSQRRPQTWIPWVTVRPPPDGLPVAHRDQDVSTNTPITHPGSRDDDRRPRTWIPWVTVRPPAAAEAEAPSSVQSTTPPPRAPTQTPLPRRMSGLPPPPRTQFQLQGIALRLHLQALLDQIRPVDDVAPPSLAETHQATVDGLRSQIATYWRGLDAHLQVFLARYSQVEGETRLPTPHSSDQSHYLIARPSALDPFHRMGDPSAGASDRHARINALLPHPPSAEASTRHARINAVLQHSRSSSTRAAEQPKTKPIDYEELTYVDKVDPLLLCSICLMPLYKAVTTQTCGHTFCQKCLERSVLGRPECPMDRERLYPGQWVQARLVDELVSRLRVECPNSGCETILARESLEAHCENLLCSMTCRYCGSKDVVEAYAEEHYEKCLWAKRECKQCGRQVVRHKMETHMLQQCSERDGWCKFHIHGCKFADKQSIVYEHEKGCTFQIWNR